MKVIRFYIGLILTIGIFAQINALKAQDDFVVRDKMISYDNQTFPKFIGGEDSLRDFISRNIHYPEEARKANIQGVVWVIFDVDKDSSVLIININSDANLLLEIEAKRVISLTNKKWIPAIKDKTYINAHCKIPITFELEDDEIYEIVESVPSFKTKSGIDQFINKNLQRPNGLSDTAFAAGVKLIFIVNTDGSVSEIMPDTAEKYNFQFMQEAIRVIIKTDLLWLPATIKGSAVRYRMSYIVRIKP